MIVLEIDPRFSSFVAQPETFRWRDGRGWRAYTPDLLVFEADNTTTYIQVKPRRLLLQNPDLQGRLPAIEAHCEARHATHSIWTEEEIRAEPRFSNARRIFAARSALVAANPVQLHERLGSWKTPMELQRASEALGSTTLVLALVASRELELDINAPITPQTKIGRMATR